MEIVKYQLFNLLYRVKSVLASKKPPSSFNHCMRDLKKTLLDVLCNEFYWFATTPSISKAALDKQIQIKHKSYPKGNIYPKSLNDALKLIKPYLSSMKKYELCINDCIIFHENDKATTVCPKCGENRYKENGCARRTFMYIPLKDRLVRLFAQSSTSKLLQDHSDVE